MAQMFNLCLYDIGIRCRCGYFSQLTPMTFGNTVGLANKHPNLRQTRHPFSVARSVRIFILGGLSSRKWPLRVIGTRENLKIRENNVGLDFSSDEITHCRGKNHWMASLQFN